ncbi:hypothetical protein GCM10011490_06810 [Pseudoclavibacter endophyticus]|uniref:Uncharacterized protein n=1 Tax=Pseudoclavibacter endophyticus TaxID=1778590 RepID=A0A6H9WG08_9MICO|nr:hypothetical protein [Pseudoclavibacter endophyticus]KAB1649832.1 hypothetical protein F8O04_06280 [Pseudoclavibacter endophyticus]GGA59428.1 hypothetical protein GCM10011490_06810 [Pseudoclavibacter endophyticus]
MTRRLVGASVGSELDRALTGLLDGSLEIADLHPALAAWWWAGWNAGRYSLAGRLQRAEDEAARWYELAYCPGARDYPDMVRRRLDAAAARWPEHANETDDFTAALEAATTPRQRAA